MARAHSPARSLEDDVDRHLAAELLRGEAGDLREDADAGLHACPACGRPFVTAGPGERADSPGRLLVELSCANCGWSERGEHDVRDLEELDEHQERATADMLWTLELLWLANEERAIARFAAALAADALLPEDFRG